jgi:hypothetical protein
VTKNKNRIARISLLILIPLIAIAMMIKVTDMLVDKVQFDPDSEWVCEHSCLDSFGVHMKSLNTTGLYECTCENNITFHVVW